MAGHVGQPSKLSPERVNRLIEAIRIGSYYEPACKVAGIAYTTFRVWMIRGEQEKTGPYAEFKDKVNEAEAQAEIEVIKGWRALMPENYAASRDFLARRHPERWAHDSKAPSQHLHVNVEGNAVLDFGGTRELIESRRRLLLDMASVRDDEETAFRTGTLKALPVPAVKDDESEDG